MKPEKEGDPVRIFKGTGMVQELDRGEVAKPVEPRPEALKDVEIGVDEVLAAQCHARGWTDLARKVLEVYHDDRWPVGKSLALSAWAYWESKALEPSSDRAAIARRLRTILEDRQEVSELVDRDLPRALELALAPGPGKAGTIEALIDGLVEVTATDGYQSGVKSPHPAYVRVVKQGFNTVPSLIKHLGDERATRTRSHGLGGPPGPLNRAGDLAQALLAEWAQPEFGSGRWPRPTKADFERWWTKAQEVGEEMYCVEHVLGEKKADQGANWPMVTVLAHKYPKRLPGVYRRMLEERPELYGHALAEAIADITLPKETKRDLFVQGARCKGWRHRQDAIQYLRAIDPEEGLKALIAALKDSHGDRPDPDGTGPRPAWWLAEQVIEAKDPQAWAALAEATDEWPNDLQLEAIQTMGRQADNRIARTERLRFLSRFLDRFLWKWAARTAAEILGLRKPNSEWTNRDWEDLVEDIRTTLARDGIR